jgi:plasmid stabilization system protein ParE
LKNLIFHPDVKEEIKASYQWYEEQAVGLGEDFLLELESSYEVISEYPDTWPNFQAGFKRYQLSRFPFSVVYKEHRNQIYIVAIMHNRRKPNYWQKRT